MRVPGYRQHVPAPAWMGAAPEAVLRRAYMRTANAGMHVRRTPQYLDVSKSGSGVRLHAEARNGRVVLWFTRSGGDWTWALAVADLFMGLIAATWDDAIRRDLRGRVWQAIQSPPIAEHASDAPTRSARSPRRTEGSAR